MPQLKLTLQLLFVAALIGCSNTPLTTTCFDANGSKINCSSNSVTGITYSNYTTTSTCTTDNKEMLCPAQIASTTTNAVLNQQCVAKALEKYKEQRCLKLYQKKICFLNSKDPMAELETDSNTQNAESYFEATDGAKIITQLQKKCISNGGRLD